MNIHVEAELYLLDQVPYLGNGSDRPGWDRMAGHQGIIHTPVGLHAAALGLPLLLDPQHICLEPQGSRLRGVTT